MTASNQTGASSSSFNPYADWKAAMGEEYEPADPLEPTNSLKRYIHGHVPPRYRSQEAVEAITQDFLEKMGGVKPPAPRQRIEKANFKFDYWGATWGLEFEHMRYATKYITVGKRKWETTEGISTPICNEYAPPDGAFVHWLNFTFYRGYYATHLDDEAVVNCLSSDLESVLGYGVTLKRSAGLNGYVASYVLGSNFGFVCIGGHSQKNTVLVMINGDGCDQATLEHPCWQYELAHWSLKVDGFRITRVDLAHDCLEGEYTVDDAVRDHEEGLFNCGGRTPAIEQRGDWRVHYDESGRTVYIGCRRSGKILRIYEKGKKEGYEDSPWVRVECEWHSGNREIPWDVLTEPGRYLAGAYPALLAVVKHPSPKRIKTLVKQTRMGYDEAVSTARHQVGTIVWLMTRVEKDAESIIKKLIRDPVSLFNRYALLAERMGKLEIQPATG